MDDYWGKKVANYFPDSQTWFTTWLIFQRTLQASYQVILLHSLSLSLDTLASMWGETFTKSHIAALPTPSNHVPWYRRVHFPFQDLVQEVQDKVDCSIMIHHTIVLLLLEYTWRWAVSLRNIPFFLPPWCYATPMMLRSVGVWCNSTKNHAIWRISIRLWRILTPKPRP